MAFGDKSSSILALLSGCIEDFVAKEVWETFMDAGFSGRLQDHVVTNSGELVGWDEIDHHVVIDVYRCLKVLCNPPGGDIRGLHAFVSGLQDLLAIPKGELLDLATSKQIALDDLIGSEHALHMVDTDKLGRKMEEHLKQAATLIDDDKKRLLSVAIADINTNAVVYRVCKRESDPAIGKD